MIDHIAKYWVSYLCGLLAAALSGTITYIKATHGKRKAEHEALLALLHDRLYQSCQFYIARGYATADDRDNLAYMYKPYRMLGGNGVCERMYNDVLALPYMINQEEA